MSCWVRLLLCGRHLQVWSGDTPMHCLAMVASGPGDLACGPHVAQWGSSSLGTAQLEGWRSSLHPLLHSHGSSPYPPGLAPVWVGFLLEYPPSSPPPTPRHTLSCEAIKEHMAAGSAAKRLVGWGVLGPGTWGEECMRPPQHTSSQVLKQSSSREL